ncbi:MAG: hypothetical protein KIS66_04430 [Fimbriimonadaceae bacterium]|nr:hypothetical protein [Fimbriimonadaceae bacterium]
MDSTSAMTFRTKCVVCLGDSITEAADADEGYVLAIRRLVEPAGTMVVNAGVGGNRSTDMRARFESDVVRRLKEFAPGLVTISVGVNDVWRFFDKLDDGVPLGTYRRMLEEMADLAVGAGGKVLFLSPTIIGEDIDAAPNLKVQDYIGAMSEIAYGKSCAFVNLFEPFARVLRAYQALAGKEGLLLTTDGVHLREAGNRLMAMQVLRALGLED